MMTESILQPYKSYEARQGFTDTLGGLLKTFLIFWALNLCTFILQLIEFFLRFRYWDVISYGLNLYLIMTTLYTWYLIWRGRFPATFNIRLVNFLFYIYTAYQYVVTVPTIALYFHELIGFAYVSKLITLITAFSMHIVWPILVRRAEIQFKVVFRE